MKPQELKKLSPVDKINQVALINKLIKANNVMTQYNMGLKHSAIDARLILSPLTLKESLASSQIEGTQATLDDILENENEDRGKIQNHNIIEVINYKIAIDVGLENIRSNIPICGRLIKKLHSILLSRNVRGSNRSPGEYRKTQNYIGAPGCNINTATYVPPSPEKVDDLMSDLENYINDYDNIFDNLDPIIRAAIIHVQFESIHPFLDGNGRIGRILMLLYLVYVNKIDYPTFFISEVLEKDRYKYYKLLNDVRDESKEGTAWNQWIEFFLDCVIIQTEKYIKLVEDINNLYFSQEKILFEKYKSESYNKLLKLLYKNPIIDSNQVVKELEISKSTANRYLKKLEDVNILYRGDSLRNIKYYCYDLLDILRGR